MRKVYFLSLVLVLFIESGHHNKAAASETLNIQRLTWAGAKLTFGETTVFIDPVGTDLWNGNAPEGLVPVSADTRRRYALITHTHNDHFDVPTLKRVLGDKGYVICHQALASHIASRGLKVIEARTFVPVLRGGFVFTAVPAEDGLGSHQVSWVLRAGNKRILHAGDTLWHGMWEKISRQFSPFDAVFLPINGATLSRTPHSETPVVMTPAQAVDAAIILRAKTLVPIHFGLTGSKDYVEVKQPLQQLAKNARRRGLSITHLRPGEVLNWSTSEAP